MCADDENVSGSFRSRLLDNNIGKAFAFSFKTLSSRNVPGRAKGSFDELGCSAEGRIVMNVSGADFDCKVMDNASEPVAPRRLCRQQIGRSLLLHNAALPDPRRLMAALMK